MRPRSCEQTSATESRQVRQCQGHKGMGLLHWNKESRTISQLETMSWSWDRTTTMRLRILPSSLVFWLQLCICVIATEFYFIVTDQHHANGGLWWIAYTRIRQAYVVWRIWTPKVQIHMYLITMRPWLQTGPVLVALNIWQQTASGFRCSGNYPREVTAPTITC